MKQPLSSRVYTAQHVRQYVEIDRHRLTRDETDSLIYAATILEALEGLQASADANGQPSKPLTKPHVTAQMREHARMVVETLDLLPAREKSTTEALARVLSSVIEIAVSCAVVRVEREKTKPPEHDTPRASRGRGQSRKGGKGSGR